MILTTIISLFITAVFIYLYIRELNNKKDVSAKYQATKLFAEASIAKSPQLQKALNKNKVVRTKAVTPDTTTPLAAVFPEWGTEPNAPEARLEKKKNRNRRKKSTSNPTLNQTPLKD